MANQLKTNPWVLDTAAATLLATYNMRIHHMEFVGYSTATHTCILKDVNGNVIWQAHGDVGLENIVSFDLGWVQGLALTTLDSGKVLVYLK